MLSVHVTGAKRLARFLESASREENKALETAMRVRGFKLMRTLQREIRQGAPGGVPFAPLSLMARKRGKGGRRKPLRDLALGVKYHWTKEPFTVRVGWTGPDRRGIRGDARQKDRVSKSWKWLASIHQEGFTRTPTKKARRYFARYGGSLSKRSKFRKVFFLRRETEQFHTPARPIMDPFWRRYEGEAWQAIRRDYRRKLRGERI